MKSFLILFLCLFSQLSFAHSNHDHSPGKKGAPNNGIIKETASYHLELVNNGQDLMIFLYDVDMKAIDDLSGYSLIAHTALPRKEKVKIEMPVMHNHFHGKFDKKDAHRFTLHVEIKKGDKLEKTEWVIE